jgi:hypothetical protein
MIALQYEDSGCVLEVAHEWITVKRVDECRCRVSIIKQNVGIGNELRRLAELLNLANEFFEPSKVRLPVSHPVDPEYVVINLEDLEKVAE